MKKFKLFSIIFSIFILFGIIGLIYINDYPLINYNSSKSPMSTDAISNYSNYGKSLNFTEYGSTSNSTGTLSLSSKNNGTSSLQIPANWEAEKLTTKVYNLMENKCWLTNYNWTDRTANRNENIHYHGWGSIDFLGNGTQYPTETRNYPIGWTDEFRMHMNSGLSGTAYMEIKTNLTDFDVSRPNPELETEIYVDNNYTTGNNYNYVYEGTASRWVHPINLDRGEIVSAQLYFDYYKYVGGTYTSKESVAVVAYIDDTPVKTISFFNIPDNTWQSAVVYINPSTFGDIPKKVNFKIGIEFISPQSGTNFAPKHKAYFDKVYLFITTIPKPSQVEASMIMGDQINLNDNFESDTEGNPANGWAVQSGTWLVQQFGGNKFYRSIHSGLRVNTIANGVTITNAVIKARMRAEDSNALAELMIRGTSVSDTYFVRIDARSNPNYNGIHLLRIEGGLDAKQWNPGDSIHKTVPQTTIVPNRWYDIEVIVIDNHFRVYLNGTLYINIIDTDPTRYSSGIFGLSAEYNGVSNSSFDDIVIYPVYKIQDDPTNWGIGSYTITPSNYWVAGNQPRILNTTIFVNSTPFYNNLDQKPVSLKVENTIECFSKRNTYHTYGTTELGTHFYTDHLGNPVWNFYCFATPPDLPSPQTDIQGYKFNITIPKDWQLKSVFNPDSPPSNITDDVLGGNLNDGYIEVPTSVAEYGYFNFTCVSPNYITSVQTLNNLNNPQTNYYINQYVRVKADLLNSVDRTANLSIYDQSGDLWYTEERSVVSGSVTFSDIYLSTTNATNGNYLVVIHWDNSTTGIKALEAGELRTNFTITHRTTLTRQSPTSDELTVFAGNIAILKVKYTDSDLGTGINGANVTYSLKSWVNGNDLNGSMVDYGGGIYSLDIDTSGKLGIYYLDVWAQGDYYDSKNQNDMFKLIIIDDTTLTYEAISSIPWGENTSLIITFKNSTGGGLSGAEISCNTSSYTVTDAGNGVYNIELGTSNWDIGSYTINITAEKLYYINRSILVPIAIRPIKTIFIAETPIPVPWEQNITFTVHYSVEDNSSSLDGQPINSIYDLTFNESSGRKYQYNNLGNGEYTIEVNLTGLSSGQYVANLTIYKSKYYNQSILVPFEIRFHKTSLTADVPDPTPWGENTTLTVYYRDLDLNCYIGGGSPVIKIDGVSRPANEISPGVFTVSAITYNWSIGSRSVNISIAQPGYETTFTSTIITIRKHLTSFTSQTPEVTPFLNNVSIYVDYIDLDNTTNQGITNSSNNVRIHCFIFSPAIPTQPIYIISEPGTPGRYLIEFNSSVLPSLSTYSIQINVSWIYQGRFQNQSITTQFVIRERRTQILYDTPEAVPYSDNLSISLYYEDIDISSTPFINNNSGNLHVSCQIISLAMIPEFWVENLSNKYILIINTSSIPSYGIYSVVINFSWANIEPHYQNKSITITITIQQITTLLSYDPPGMVAWSSTENATFTITYYDLDHSRGITGATINLTLISPSVSSFTYHNNWSYTDLGDGSYLIEIVMDYMYELTYNFRIDVNKSNYVPDTLSNVNLTIRGTYTILSSPESPSATIPIGVYNISLYYIDRERGINVGNDSAPYLNITIFTYDSNKTLINNLELLQIGPDSNPTWKIRINTTNFNMDLTYNLTIWANRTHYEFQSINISIKLIPRESALIVTNPAQQVWGEETSFKITYTDQEGNYISDVDININWTRNSTNYYYFIDNLDGTYDVFINTSAKTIGTYILEVNITAPGFSDRTNYVTLSVRAVDSQLLYSPPSTTPYNDNVSFWVKYIDSYHGVSINGSNIEFDCNLSSSYWDWHFDPVELGKMWIEVDTSVWNSYGSFPIKITVNWTGEPYYSNQSTIVNIKTRSRATELIGYPPDSVVFGLNSTIKILYRDLDNNSLGISNSTNSWGSNVKINVYLYNSTYIWFGPLAKTCWINEVGSGYYNIIINTTKIGDIGTFRFLIYVNWSGKPYYNNKSTVIEIVVNTRDTEITYIPAETVGFGLNATLNISYIDIQGNKNINNQSYNVQIEIYDLNNTLWSSNGYAWIIEITNGYMIKFNTSKLANIGNYIFTIYANYTGIPYYAPASINVTIRVRARNTELTYESPPITIYGEKVNISVYYKDLDTNLGIDNSTLNIIFYLPSINIYRVLNMQTIEPGRYYIEVDTNDNILKLGINSIQISVYSKGAPFYVNRTINISLSVRKIETTLNVGDYPKMVPWNSNLTIIFTYNDSDHNDIGILISQNNISCGWAYGYTITIISTGKFKITFNTSVQEQSWTTWVFVNKTYYREKNVSITFTIRKVYTDYYTNTSFVSNWAYGYSFTSEIEYRDSDNNVAIQGNIQITGDAPWVSGNYSVRYDTNASKWYVTFDTAFTEENVIYRINVTLYQDHYMNQSFQIMVTIQYPPSALLIIDTDPGTIVPFGDELIITVTHNDTEQYKYINGSTIWLEPQSIWPASNYTVTEIGFGVYEIRINTTWEYRPEGSYRLTIKAHAEHYENTSTATTITIRKIATDLTILSAPSFVNFGLNASISIQLNDTDHNVGLNNSIFNVYWKDSSNTLHEWSGPDVNGSYSVIKNSSTGLYTLLINTSTDLGLGSFQLYINASLDSSWGNWQKHYEMASTLYILQITTRSTSLTAINTPEGDIPWGDTFNITVAYNDTVKLIGISTSNVSVSGWGNNYIWQEICLGVYEIKINSTTILPTQFNTLLPVYIHLNKTFYDPQTIIVYVVIRKIRTFFGYNPPSVTPYNNSLVVQTQYKDIDHNQYILNNSGKVFVICNISNYGASYTINNETNGRYFINIDTSTLPEPGIYAIMINISWSGSPYYQNKTIELTINVRNITTLLVINPVNPVPWNTNLTITINYVISDFESIHDNDPIENAYITISSLYTPFTVYEDGNGVYRIEINASSLQNVGTHSLWIFAKKSTLECANETFSFQVRPRSTDIDYNPPEVTPFEFYANITIQYRDLDRNNIGISNNSGNIRISALVNSQVFNYIYIDNLSNGVYIIHINTWYLDDIGTYDFTIWVNWTYNSQYSNSSIIIPVIIEARETQFSYDTPQTFAYGSIAEITLYYLDMDKNGQGISNISSYGGQKIRGRAIIDGNMSETSYTFSELAWGKFSLRINTLAIKMNQIGYHFVQVNFSWIGKPFFSNMSLTIQFNIRKVYTDYSILIGNESTLVYTGWPWGIDVPIIINYLDTDFSRNVNSSFIIFNGDLVYNNDNYTVTNYNNGTFKIILKGDSPQHGINYEFNVKLYKNELYMNQTFTFMISFKKSLTTLLIHPDLTTYIVSWGDNASIYFSYNNTEIAGYPGIPNAHIEFSIETDHGNKTWAEGNTTVYEVQSLGLGMYALIMNTTWAENVETEVKFTITAEVPNAILAQTLHTIHIRLVNTRLTLITYNRSIWIEEYSNFNVTVHLEDLDHLNQTEGSYQGIENNSDPEGLNVNLYQNLKFYFYRNGKYYHSGIWEYGNITIFNRSQLGWQNSGYYYLVFTWNSSLVEEIDYVFYIYSNGTYLKEASTQIIVTLKFRIHKTNITTNYTIAKSVNPDLPNFTIYQDYSPNGLYYFGDTINITFFYYDAQPGYLGNGTDGAFIECNWSSNYYRIFRLDEEINESWAGIYIIQIKTLIINQFMAKNWTIEINASKNTAVLQYELAQLKLPLRIHKVPTDLNNFTQIIPTPIHNNTWVELPLNYTDKIRGTGIIRPDNITVLNWINSSYYYYELYGYGGYILKLRTIAKNKVGVYNATVLFQKLNYEDVIKNFTVVLRNSYTALANDTIGTYKIKDSVKYLSANIFRIRYYVSYYEIIDQGLDITGASIKVNWTGNYSYYWSSNYYYFILNTTLDVGNYTLNITFSKKYYETQNLIFKMIIEPAITYIYLEQIENPNVNFPRTGYQGFGISIKLRFVAKLEKGDLGLSNASITFNVTNQFGKVVLMGTATNIGYGYYSITIYGLSPGYYIISIKGKANNNFETYVRSKSVHILPFTSHPLFIALMVAIGTISAVIVYRQVRWWLKPYQIKEIIKAQKLIKKGKEIAKVPVVMSRDESFSKLYSEYWSILDLKMPKLVQPEIVNFAMEMSSILRVRITTAEAETIVNELRKMDELEADNYLAERNIPPEARRRLLMIVGVIKKERYDIKEFREKLIEIKQIEITYEQAEEMVSHIKEISPNDALDYLVSTMILSTDDAINLLKIVGVEVKPKEIVKGKRIQPPEKTKPKPSDKDEKAHKKVKSKPEKKSKEKRTPMSESELRKELDKFDFLTEEERESLLEELKKMSYDEQKKMLEEIK